MYECTIMFTYYYWGILKLDQNGAVLKNKVFSNSYSGTSVDLKYFSSSDIQQLNSSNLF